MLCITANKSHYCSHSLIVNHTEAEREGKLPQLQDIQLLRYPDDEEPYFFFLDKILECVAGRRGWKKARTTQLVSQYCTVSDEAFALLTLENNWEKWEKRQKRGPGKYTSSTQGNKMFEGWSEEGLKRYNQIYQVVKQDRNKKEAKAFEMRFRDLKQEEDKAHKKRQAMHPKKTFTIMNDLSEEEWDEENDREESDEENVDMELANDSSLSPEDSPSSNEEDDEEEDSDSDDEE